MIILVFAYIFLAYWLHTYFARNDRGAKEPIKALRLAGFMGIVAGLLAGDLNQLFLPDSFLEYFNNDINNNAFVLPETNVLIKSALLIGIIEESLKFVPLAILLYKKPYFNETTDGIVYFGLAGMWFGALENIFYAMDYGSEVGITRLIMTPFLHAGLSALVGWGLAQYKVEKTSLFLPVGLFAGAVLAHALYNLLAFSGSALSILIIPMAIAINAGVFVLFNKSRRRDEQLGISASGTNNFCRSCGRPNPQRNLFCVNCGKKT